MCFMCLCSVLCVFIVYLMLLSFVIDNYVHRLVQNKTDGKLVQIEGANNSVCVCSE